MDRHEAEDPQGIRAIKNLCCRVFIVLFALVRKGTITAITSASSWHFAAANAYRCIFRDHSH